MTNLNDKTCTNCGCTGEMLYKLTLEGQTIEVCADCAKALGFIQCADCGEWIDDDSYTNDKDEVICKSCFDTGYFVCEHCGSTHSRIDDLVRVNEGTVRELFICKSCAEQYYYRCNDCGGYFTSGFLYWQRSNGCICNSCSDDWTVCENCGDIIRYEDAHEQNGDHYCDSCWPRFKRSRHFHEYGYKPLPRFHLRAGEDAHKTLTFGVELEVDKGDDHNDVSDVLGELDQPIYMKHDGSLGEEGVEIVTHPCSLAYHTYQLRWKEITRKCRQYGYLSHDTSTCGLHIHVGRLQMGESWNERNRTAGNLVILARKLWPELVTFSRRTESALNNWAERPDIHYWVTEFPGYSDCEKTDAALHTEGHGRYQAVNLCNSNTVEFRLFRGTLKRDTLIAALQLTSNLTHYAMTHTPTECFDATWLDVLNVERYAELIAYCKKRHLPTT